jgi:serine protease Do
VKAVVVRSGSRQTLNVTPEAGGRFTTRDALPDDLERRIERGLRDVPRTFSFDLDDALAFGARGRLGATVTPISDQLAQYFGVKSGVLVSTVTPDSPAARAGLKAGDVITTANGRTIERPTDLTTAIREAATARSVELRVMRDRKESTITVTLPERERPRLNTGRYPV